MNLSDLHQQFNSQSKCFAYLEKLRWNRKVICPYCNSRKTYRLKKEKRHHCKACKRNFSVLVGTIFEHTRLSLPLWFQLIFLMTTSKRGISAKNLMRNIGIPYKTAWYSAMRVRCAMINNCNVLQDIVEMDETYAGGKPRKKYPKDRSQPNVSQFYFKRGRGTSKTPIVGIVERNGKVVLNVMQRLDARSLSDMLKKYVNTDKAIVITDDFRSYKKFDNFVAHITINKKKRTKMANINTIEGFFSIIKNSIKGNNVAVSKKYLSFYLIYSAYIYNHRNFKGDFFSMFMKDAISHRKCMKYYHPIDKPEKLIQQCK